MTSNIERRLRKLEGMAHHESRRFVELMADLREGQTSDGVIAQWCAANPAEQDSVDFIVMVIVDHIVPLEDSRNPSSMKTALQ